MRVIVLILAELVVTGQVLADSFLSVYPTLTKTY